MFIENFVELCNRKHESPHHVTKFLKFGNSAFTDWSDGSVPRDTSIKKIADYFGVHPHFFKQSNTFFSMKEGFYDGLCNACKDLEITIDDLCLKIGVTTNFKFWLETLVIPSEDYIWAISNALNAKFNCRSYIDKKIIQTNVEKNGIRIKNPREEMLEIMADCDIDQLELMLEAARKAKADYNVSKDETTA